jgi:DNA-binding SARP family transcriptional activator
VGDRRPSLRPMHRTTPPAQAPLRVRLHLLSGFDLVRGDVSVTLAPGAERLVAFLALQERPVRREFAAGMLWPDVPDDRAAANLRSTLWRVQKQLRGLVSTRSERLRIDPATDVDLRDAERAAHAVLTGGDCDIRVFSSDLLPDWYDDWVVLERERFRQLRLSALETLCDRHTTAGRLGPALEAGLLSVASEPLRESAHRALIRVHLATGNAVEAIRQYGVCRRLLRDQLGIEPTQQLRELIDAIGT